MFNLRQTMLFLLLLISTLAWADDKLKVLHVGAPQVGPAIILTQALADNLTVPYEFISMKDCAGALRVIEQEKNVLFVTQEITNMTGIRKNEDCIPQQLRPRDIVGYTVSSWDLCKKAGSNAKIGPNKFSIGIVSVLPVTGIVDDFNKLNGTKAIGVALPSSIQIITALANGDLQWGMVSPGLSRPAMKEGTLECPLTFIPQGSDKISKEKFIGNHYKMTVPFLRSAYFMTIKSTDTKIRIDVDKAVTSTKFNEFLTKSGYVSTKAGLGNFSDADIDDYFGYINELLTKLYSLPAYDWKKRI